MLTIAQKTIFFFHSLESSFDLQSKKKIGVGHQPNPPCKSTVVIASYQCRLLGKLHIKIVQSSVVNLIGRKV